MHGISFTWQSGVIWSIPGATRWFYLYSAPVTIPAQNTYSFLLNPWVVWYAFEAFKHVLDIDALRQSLKKTSCCELCGFLSRLTGKRKWVKGRSRIPQKYFIMNAPDVIKLVLNSHMPLYWIVVFYKYIHNPIMSSFPHVWWCHKEFIGR